MATRKEGPADKKAAAATKPMKSAGTRNGGTTTAGSRPTNGRRPTKPATDAPSSDVIQTGASSAGMSAGNARAHMSPEEVYRLIQETAYYKAKARGFAPGHEVQDWVEAEAEVRLRLEHRP